MEINSHTVELNESDKAVTLASHWVLSSKIQSLDQQPDRRGAFYAWVDEDAEKSNFIYPEITGYGMTTLLYVDSQGLARGNLPSEQREREGEAPTALPLEGATRAPIIDTLQNNKELLRRACLAGDWVLNDGMHSDFGGVPPRKQFSSNNILVTFDTGMVLCGLTHLYKRSQNPTYLKGAQRMANFLIDHGQKENGLFYPCFDLAIEQWTDTVEKWSTQSGSYHAKLALGLLHLYHLTGAKQYQGATKRVCRASLELQDASGRFITYRNDTHAGPNGGATHMHPHLYSVEGMLTAGLTMNQPDFVDSAVRAVEWTLDQQLSDGGIPCLVHSSGRYNVNQRSDTLAQALRMGSLCYGMGKLPASSLDKLAKLGRKLLTYQEISNGGFYYGTEADGTPRNHLNFWCTAFALQALATYGDVIHRKMPPSTDYLI